MLQLPLERLSDGRPTPPNKLAELLTEITSDPRAVLIPGHFLGNESGQPFQIVFEHELARLLGKDVGDDALAGIHSVGAERFAARLKRSIEPCAWLLIDCDTPEGMPADLAALALDARLNRMETFLPGISTCERVELRSSSARVVAPGAAPGRASHAWLRVSQPHLVPLLRLHVQVEAALHGLDFESPRRSTKDGNVVGKARLTLIDLGVWITGRLVFCSQPVIQSRMAKVGWTVADAGITIVNAGGGVLDIGHLVAPAQERLDQYKAITNENLKISRQGQSVSAVSHGPLALDTAIDVPSRRALKTFGDAVRWLRKHDRKGRLRCQTPFRASISEAAFIRIDPSGEPFLHDVGTNTSYRLAERLSEPPTPTSEKDYGKESTRAPLVGHCDSPQGSEDAMALELVATHGHELRYIAQFGKWFRWDGCRWAEDRTVAIYDLARIIARESGALAEKDAVARKTASAATVSGIERLARSDRRLALTIEEFDADPALLNTPGGIIDLRTGTIRPCDPAALCSQITAVAPAAHDDCPTWKTAISLYMDGDSEVVAFLQRLAGYFLWGAVVDQIINFASGKGGNGKGTVYNTVARIMGTYAKVAQSEVFLSSTFDRHPTELARLHNARLVTASEIDKGRRWNMSRLNQLSGGDSVTAHFMRQDDFEYIPKFKLAIFANNKPGFGKVDEAIRRRLFYIAFNHTVTDQARAADPTFADKIKAEWPAILRWMISGCLDWQREGLNPPQQVIDASEEYLASQNNLVAWLADGCVTDTSGQTTLKDLFASWKKWCDEHGEQPGSSRGLADLLEEQGFPRIRIGKFRTRGHAGLRLATT